MKTLLKSMLVAMLLPLFALMSVPPAIALTTMEFKHICTSTPAPCSDHPLANAYIGGALDLIAVLHEQNALEQKIYCREPREFFKVDKIIDYILVADASLNDTNTMVLLVRFLEQHGGCPDATKLES